MSKHLVTLIYGKVVGKAIGDDPKRVATAVIRKAVLVALADRANDDGSGVYVSKSRVAAELECDRSTVIRACYSLEDESFLHVVGKKTGNHGYTDIYQISVSRIHDLPDAWSKSRNRNTLDEGLGEDAEVSPSAALENVQVLEKGGSSVAARDKNRPYKTIEKHAGVRERANGPSADRPVGSSSGPSQADFRMMAADPEYARDHRDVTVEESPRSKLATLRDELETLERIHAKYPELSGSDYSTRRDRLLGEISQLENSEN